MDAFRKLVSKKKRRFVTGKDHGGFDLDLTYITPKIIAMGFPSESLEGVYRNPMSEVVRFLDTKHFNKFKIYNLCSERSYDPIKFHGRVSCYPFEDHNAPPLEMIKPFCEDVESWLKSDAENVAVVHCKAGKGRTGVMICSYLVHCGEWLDADEAMKFYGMARTENAKGVTIPSQQRYVRYYAEMVTQNKTYKERTIFLKKIIIHTIPRFNSGGSCHPTFIIRKGHTKTYQSPVVENVSKDMAFIEIQPKSIQPLCGDIKVEFFHKEKFKQATKMFHFWFNTFFVQNDELLLQKSDLDKANKDKKNALFDETFMLEVQFASLDDQGDEKPGRPRSTVLAVKEANAGVYYDHLGTTNLPVDRAGSLKYEKSDRLTVDNHNHRRSTNVPTMEEKRTSHLDPDNESEIQTDEEDENLSDDESVLEYESQMDDNVQGEPAGSAEMA